MNGQRHVGRLAGRRALITGASSGLGAAVAELFSAEGAELTLVSRSRASLTQTAARLAGVAHAVPADVSDPDAVRAAVADAGEAMGGLDIVVNAAGVISVRPLETIDDDEWRRVLDTNLSGSFYVAREAARLMRDAGSGVIVNVGSDLSFNGAARYVHYCAAKAGILGLTKALAKELAPLVRVNAFCPGPIDTPMLAHELADAPELLVSREAIAATVPLRRIGSPEEMAPAVLFLACDATYSTGAMFSMDGGTTLG